MRKKLSFTWIEAAWRHDFGGGAMMRSFWILGLLLLSSCLHAEDIQIAPDVLVRQVATEILASLQGDKGLSGDRKKLLDLVDVEILPHFDFLRMTRLAMGEHWHDASPGQQAVLVKEFRALLAHTYADVLSDYDGQRIEFHPLKLFPGEQQVRVSTTVVSAGGDSFPMDYLMEKTPSGWEAYDVVIDSVSVLAIYRTSFAFEIGLGGIDRLIGILVEKDQQAGPF